MREQIEAAIRDNDLARALRLTADTALTSADLDGNFSNACRSGALELARAMHATGKVTTAHIDDAIRWRKIFADRAMLEWLLALGPTANAVEQLMYNVVTGPDEYEDDATLDAWLGKHRLLLEWGAKPRDATAGTLMAVALEAERNDFADYLLTQGIPLAHARALTGRLPMQRAREALDRIPMRSAVEAQAMLAGALASADATRVARALEAGADPNVAYPDVDWRDDFLPLALAARAQSVECVELLVRAGANVNKANGVALKIAAEFGALEAVRALITAGADVDADNGAALTAAAGQGEIECMAVLVASGATVDAGNQRALREAQDAQKPDAVQWLRARGAKQPGDEGC